MTKVLLEPKMEFKNTKELCTYLNWSYDHHYTRKIQNEFSKYVNFHIDKNKIIIDKIINNDIVKDNLLKEHGISVIRIDSRLKWYTEDGMREIIKTELEKNNLSYELLEVS